MAEIKIRAIIDCSFPMVRWQDPKSGKIYNGSAVYAVKLLAGLISEGENIGGGTKMSLDKVIFAANGELTLKSGGDLLALSEDIDYKPTVWSGRKIRDMIQGKEPPSSNIMEYVLKSYKEIAAGSEDVCYVLLVFANSSLSCRREDLEEVCASIRQGDIPGLSVFYVKTDDAVYTKNVIDSGLARIQDESRRVSLRIKKGYSSYRQSVRIMSVKNINLAELKKDLHYLRKLIKDTCEKESVS